MIILTKGIREISRRGNIIILNYSKEEEALEVINRICDENMTSYNNDFPYGVFQDGKLKKYRR